MPGSSRSARSMLRACAAWPNVCSRTKRNLLTSQTGGPVDQAKHEPENDEVSVVLQINVDVCADKLAEDRRKSEDDRHADERVTERFDGPDPFDDGHRDQAPE